VDDEVDEGGVDEEVLTGVFEVPSDDVVPFPAIPNVKGADFV
jgi:hypothetical protein